MYEVQRPPLQSLDRPDERFAFVGGLYVATLLTPVVVFCLDRWVTSNADLLYLAVFVVVPVLGGVAAWRISHSRGLPERVGAGRRRSALLIAAPLAAFVGYWFLLSASTSWFAGIAFSSLGMFLGIGLAEMSDRRYTAAVVEAAGVDATVTGKLPAAAVQRRRFVGLVGLSLSIVAIGGFLFWDQDLLAILDVQLRGRNLLGIVGFLLLNRALHLLDAGGETTYQITPAGLVSADDDSQAITHWDAFAGYEVTDDAILLHSTGWWQPATRLVRDDTEDSGTVERELGRYLPRA